jgi:hypothetical protein
VEDIVGIFDVVDKNERLCNISFAPADLARLPRYSPEDINQFSISERQTVIDAAVESMSKRVCELETLSKPVNPINVDAVTDIQRQLEKLSCSVDAKFDSVCSTIQKLSLPPSPSPSMSTCLDAMQSKLDGITSGLNARLESITASVDKLSCVQSLPQPTGTGTVFQHYLQPQRQQQPQPQRMLHPLYQQQQLQQSVQYGATSSASTASVRDRSFNIVVFGVQEDNNVNVWRQKVFDVLKFTVGRPVAVSEMFRVGGRVGVAGKVRPIVVKLMSTWDRRTALSCSPRLKAYPERIYIAADEPLETRRQNTLFRLKQRAERDGKQTVVINGVLQVDGVNVFSLAEGFPAVSERMDSY